jgi:hypothetical protein
VIAEKKLGVKYVELTCKSCKATFHAELGAARMAPSAERVVLENEFPFSELSQPFAKRLLDYAKGSAAECLERAKELAAMVEFEKGLKCPQCGVFAGEFLRDVLTMHSAATRRSQIDKKHLKIQPTGNRVKPVFSYLVIDPEWLKGASGVVEGAKLGGYSDAPLELTASWFTSRLNHLRFVEVRGQIKLDEDTSSFRQLDRVDEASHDEEAQESTNDGDTESEEVDRREFGLPRYITLRNGRQIDTRAGTVPFRESAGVRAAACWVDRRLSYRSYITCFMRPSMRCRQVRSTPFGRLYTYSRSRARFPDMPTADFGSLFGRNSGRWPRRRIITFPLTARLRG